MGFTMKTKIISMMLAVLMAGATFTGCANNGSGSPSSDTGSTDGAGTASTSMADQIKSKDDLAGKKLGVQAGTTGETWCTENASDAKVSSYKSGMDAALDLKNGRLDAVVIDELPAKAIVEQNSDLQILEVTLGDPEEYAIAVKKGNTELLESINKTIARMKEDGTYQKLNDAFMPADGNIVIPENLELTGDKTLKMGTNAAFKPFEYVEGTDPVGFDVCMSQEIAKDFGAKLEVKDMAFDSLIGALSAGTIDFVAAGMSVTPDREANVDFSDTYYASKQVVIVKK